MRNTSTAVKDRWNKKAYDQMPIRVPKGLKQRIEAYAHEKGMSLNGYVNGVIREDMGLPEEEWKREQNDQENE